MARKCKICKDEKNYNFAINNGLCNSCIEEKFDRMEEALERIQTWSKAYPLKAFPKPDLKKAHEALKAVGMTLDVISADAMRHVLDGVKDIAKQALKAETG